MNKSLYENIGAVDLFCGAGGLTHGLIKSGIPVYAGFDLDPACSYAYEKNNHTKFVQGNIKDITVEQIENCFPKDVIKIMVGCAPCQTFSTHTHKVKNRESDVKWDLISVYLDKILTVVPIVVSMENVPGITKYPIFHDFVKKLKESGYFVSYSIVFCPDYGIPQKRKRLVLLASKLGEISLAPATHTKDQYVTVADTIGNLNKISAGRHDKTDLLHRCSSISALNLKRFKASKAGGSWEDWPEALKADCHKKQSGKSYRSVYSRMQWNEPSPTITTQFNNFGTGRFGHPTQNRSLSIREGALLQTFPSSYTFFPDESEISFKVACRMIGNAVPVKLGEVIGNSIIQHLASHHKINKN